MSASKTCSGAWRLTDEDMKAIERLRKELLNYARRRTGSTADAEDIFGETLIAAGRTFEHRSTLRHYLYAILKRQVANLCRRKQRGPPWGGPELAETEFDEIFEDTPGPDTQLSWARNAQKIRTSLERIPPAYREVVRLAVDGYDNYEIAAKLGVQYNTVRSRLSRGNAYLVELLLDDGGSASEPVSKPRRDGRTAVCSEPTFTV